MPATVSKKRIVAIADAARVPLAPDAAARIARAVTMPVTRLAAANIALNMEVEPATFVAIQRKDTAS
jgi:hypothetical protein